MVTKRLNDLKTKRSIDSFKMQTYKNKELIIVYSHSNHNAVYEMLDYTNDIECVFYNIRDDISLGEARNISILISEGDIICQWDDDDISHKERLSFQYDWNTKNNANASILSAQYHLFENETPNRLFLENRKQTNNVIHNGWCGTIMANKNIMKNIYPQMKIEEDFHGLSKINDLKVITYNTPYYHYIYSYHGDNTWDLQHNLFMVDGGTNFYENENIKKWIENNFNYRLK